jgi:F0F1-type ATP synthase alpha subunit
MQNEIDNVYLANYAEVIKVGDGIVRLSGLAEAMSGEIVGF